MSFLFKDDQYLKKKQNRKHDNSCILDVRLNFSESSIKSKTVPPRIFPNSSIIQAEMNRLADPIGAHTHALVVHSLAREATGDRGAKESKRRMNSDYNETQINPRHAGRHERVVAVFLHVCRSVGGSSADCTRRLSNHALVAINVPRLRVNFNDPPMRANE